MQRDLTHTWMPEARRLPLASAIRACGAGAFDEPPGGEV
jgi:hypothetical protein